MMETNSEIIQMLDLSNQHFKAASHLVFTVNEMMENIISGGKENIEKKNGSSGAVTLER